MRTCTLLLNVILLLALLLPSAGSSVLASNMEGVRAQIPSISDEEKAPTITSNDPNVEKISHNTPIMFVENVGQFAKDARFKVQGGNSTLWLTDNALWITLFEQGNGEVGEQSGTEIQRQRELSHPQKGVNLKLSFPNANPQSRIEPFNRLETTVSYFIGNETGQWRSDVPVWGGVRYVDLYPGIDLEVTSVDGNWVQRLRVSPGVDLSEVQLRIEGAQTVELDDYVLRLNTGIGKMTLPLLTQPSNLLAEQPSITKVSTHTFDVSLPFLAYSPLALSIQNSLSQQTPSHLCYATFLGGSNYDNGNAIALDSKGNVYVMGTTISSDFPTTTGAYDLNPNGNEDVFVSLLDPTLSILRYATFLGGGNKDSGKDIALDSDGNVYVTGDTLSSDFPTTPDAYDTNLGPYSSTDAFVSMLDSTLSNLHYATLLGRTYSDYSDAIALSSTGDVYITGYTYSSGFPVTSEAYDTSFNGDYGRSDVFLSVLDPTLSILLYSTFLGGSGRDFAYDIALDSIGYVYATGYTYSDGFPITSGAYDTSHNGREDAFVSVLDATLGTLYYATFLGGDSFDRISDIALDGMGNIYMTGETSSDSFPITSGAYDTSHNGREDAFVSVLDSTLSNLLYSTFLGGSDSDSSYAIALDNAGNAHVTGETESSDFPTTLGAYDTNSSEGWSDVFLSVLSSGLGSLRYATFLGGSDDDRGWGIAIDGNFTTYVTGETYSSDFPTTSSAFDTMSGSDLDAFVVNLDTTESPPDSIPAPVSLALAIEDWIHPAANLQVGAWLDSEASEPITYTVRTTLSPESQTPIVREKTVVASEGNDPYLTFDFGTRDVGSYDVLVEAILDDTVLDSQMGRTQVLSSTDVAQALTASSELTRIAHWELNEGQESVVWAYGESVPGLASEAADWLMGELLDLIPWVGDAIGATAGEITEASYEINAKLQDLEGVIDAASRPEVERRVHQVTNAYLNSERWAIDVNRQQYDAFALSHNMSWSSEKSRLTQEYWEVISTRVEEERDTGLATPSYLFRKLSLKEREGGLLFYKRFGDYLGKVILLACIALLIIKTGFIGTPTILKNLWALKPILEALKAVTAMLLVLLAIEMNFKLETVVAPAIRDRHKDALTELQSLAVQSDQQKELNPEVQMQIAGDTVTLRGFFANDPTSSDTQLQTKLYSADGRLIEIQTHSPTSRSGTQSSRFHLQPGTYRTVTSAPVIGNLGRGAQVNAFEIAGPQVAFDLRLGTSQLEISETLQANLWVTSTNTITGTGPLALIVEASDGDNGDAWVVELDAEEHQEFDLSFVPPETGSYFLRARLFGPDGTLLALREAGYVVGSGPALAIEAWCKDDWQPGDKVTTYITATNSGNGAAHNILDVVTWDQESQQSIYTTTLPLNLSANATESYTITALSDAQPGRYRVNLLLDGESYLSLPFVVAAENTLLVVAETTSQYGAIGQKFDTAIEVVDVTYALTDATVTAYVVDPLFTTHPISVSHNGTGLYSAAYTSTLTGTHEIIVTVAREDWRGDSASASFVAQQASQLASTVNGSPQVGQLRTVTVTAHNEHNLPAIDALVTISGTQEYISRRTDASGKAVFPLQASSGTPYEVWIEKPGYATTRFELAVDPGQIYLPLVLRNL